MAQKMTIKGRTPTGWDVLHPKTHVEQIEGLLVDGKLDKNIIPDITLDPSDIGAATAEQGKKADSALQTVPFENAAGNIRMNGTAAAGSSGNVARADHVHPADTGRAASTHSHGNATSTAAGFMSGEDKARLDGLPTITVSATAPTTPRTGDLWYDFNN
jgi:hypothetical protein